MQFADVILPLNLSGLLTYSIPVKYQQIVQPGIRVEVNLGKNKLYSGIIIRIHNEKPEAYQIKPIRAVLDEVPVVLPVQLSFWRWIAHYYMSSLGDVMNAALPAHLKLMSETLLIWNESVGEPSTELTDEGFMLAEALQIRKQLSIDEARLILEGKNTAKAINELLEQGYAIVSEYLEERYKPKKSRYIFLHEDFEQEKSLNELFNKLEKYPKQLNLLMQFLQMRQIIGSVLQSDLLKKAEVSLSSLKSLIDKNVLKVNLVEVDRINFTGEGRIKEFELSPAQNISKDDVIHSWKEKNVTLLHGVTGSGKTLIYVSLIKEAIAKGGQALFLLPEIALTTQVVSRLKSYFGSELGVYHSRFSNNERVEIWNKVKDKKYKVVIGPRSALWLPFDQLKCIIVDEEHDASYKQQDPAPRFHARDSAIYLAQIHNCKVLLGSATPSIETTANIKSNKYGYVSLKERYRGVSMPQIEVISAKNIRASLSSFLTVGLLEEIGGTLQNGQQVILFQNKRGYAPFLICSICGWLPHCKYCDVSMSYHKFTDKMHCHYCGTKYPPIKHCPQCGNAHIIAKNFGTERVEEDLQRIFPKSKIARMDLDSMRSQIKQGQIIDDFSKGRIDILVGTQMVVKGLDFDHVGLVGILSADSLLSYPDFRVDERAFQLMEQVSGRAGRNDGKGKVLIQAHKMDHPVINWVKNHDYKSLFLKEYREREKFNYPPFCRMIKLTCKHRDDKKVKAAAQNLVGELKLLSHIEIRGPVDPLVSRVRNYFLQEIWLKLPLDAFLIEQIKLNILEGIRKILQQKGFSGLHIAPDVDPA